MSNRRGEIHRRKATTEKALGLLMQAEQHNILRGDPASFKINTAQADALMTECVRLLHDAKQTQVSILVPALSFAAELAEANTDSKRSQALYQETLDLLKSATPWTLKTQNQIAKMEGNIATHHYHQGRWEDSEALFRQALTREGVAAPVRARHLQLLTKIALRRGDVVKADEYCQSAFDELEVYNANDPEGFYLRAGTLSLLASIYEAQGKLTHAESPDGEALGLAMKCGPDGLGCGLPIVDSLRRMGESLLSKKMPGEAETFLSHAYSVYRAQIEQIGLTFGTELEPCFRTVKVYAKVLKALGKEREAKEVLRDVNDSEAKLEARFKVSLEETRKELVAEKKGVGRGRAAGQPERVEGEERSGEGGKTKLSRKQKKRKAEKAAKKTEEGGEKEAEQEEEETDEKQEKNELVPSVAEIGKAMKDVSIAEKLVKEKEVPQQRQDDGEEEECALCLCEINRQKDDNLWLLNCTHLYHRPCLERWLDKCLEKKVQASCPMCRAPIISQ